MHRPDYLALEGIPRDVFDRMKHLWETQQDLRAGEANETREAIKSRWESEFSLFQKCAALASVIGDAVGHKFCEKAAPGDQGQHSSGIPGAINDEWMRFLTLVSLHAKSCVIAEEVRTLLTAGFLEGARARLRAMHECLVFASLVGANRDGVLAARYHDSATMEHWKVLCQIQEHHVELGWEPVDARTMQKAAEDRDCVKARWGPRIDEDYEWARPAVAFLGNSGRQRPQSFTGASSVSSGSCPGSASTTFATP